MSETADSALVEAASAAELRAKGRMIVKITGKQVALFDGPKGVFACNNRCPHEGYPLVEGSLADGCVLTCNWHNWKFDLESGETLVGGDRLRRYPVRIEGDRVLVDVTDPPAAQTQERALASLKDAFPRHEYDRMAREIARLEKAGGSAETAIAAAVEWTHENLEFGTTHAHLAAPDWLALRNDYAEAPADRLSAVVEIIGHLAWDTLRAPEYPYEAQGAPYNPDGLFATIEAEDEDRAVAMVRTAFADGLIYGDLEGPLARAALEHYADFGHAAIGVLKTGQLIDRLGAAEAPLTLALVRALVYGRREDLIPEFRHYAAALKAFDGSGTRVVTAEDLRGASVNAALDLCVAASGDVPALFDALLGALAEAMLHFDLDLQNRTEIPVSQNVGWLDFTHSLTFANAARHLCAGQPDLWPAALLQMACFLGRNVRYVGFEQDMSRWAVPDAERFFQTAAAGLFDHGQFDYITSTHRLKVLMAVRDEVRNRPDAPWVPALLAATNRYLGSPLKRKHVARTARQAMAFVAAEG